MAVDPHDFEVTLDWDDYTAYIGLIASGGADDKIDQTHFADFTAVVFFGLCAILLILGFAEPWLNGFFNLPSVAAGLAAGGILFSALHKLRWRRYRQKVKPHDNDPFFQPSRYRVDDLEIRTFGEHSNATFQWEGIMRLVENDTHLLALLGPRQALVFPKSRVAPHTIEFLRGMGRVWDIPLKDLTAEALARDAGQR